MSAIIKWFVAIALVITATTTFADKATEVKIDALNARMQRIERVVDNQALLGLAKKIEAMQREIQELRGENERLSYELNTLKERQREQYLDIDRRLQGSANDVGSSVATTGQDFTTNKRNTSNIPQGEKHSTPSVTNTTSSQVVTTTSTTSVSTTSTQAAQDYKDAFTLLKQGKYDDSIVAFEAFLRNHVDSKYASNAQYWLAEANYVSKRYPKALSEFSKVVNNYPASSKVADARLKLGFTYYELEQYEEARLELTRLRAQFPNSSVATLAQQRLERMSREGK